MTLPKHEIFDCGAFYEVTFFTSLWPKSSADPLLNQMDSPDFTWCTKNIFWDELNVLKRNSFVKSKNTTDDY